MSFFHTRSLLWIICAPISYFTMREISKAEGSKWTQADRLFALVFSVLYGPIMLVVIAVTALICQIANSSWANREAKW